MNMTIEQEWAQAAARGRAKTMKRVGLAALAAVPMLALTVFFAATDRGIVFGPALAGVVAALIILRRR